MVTVETEKTLSYLFIILVTIILILSTLITLFIVTDSSKGSELDIYYGERRKRIAQDFEEINQADELINNTDKEPHGIWKTDYELENEVYHSVLSDHSDFITDETKNVTYSRRYLDDSVAIGSNPGDPSENPPEAFYDFEEKTGELRDQANDNHLTAMDEDSMEYRVDGIYDSYTINTEESAYWRETGVGPFSTQDFLVDFFILDTELVNGGEQFFNYSNTETGSYFSITGVDDDPDPRFQVNLVNATKEVRISYELQEYFFAAYDSDSSTLFLKGNTDSEFKSWEVNMEYDWGEDSDIRIDVSRYYEGRMDELRVYNNTPDDIEDQDERYYGMYQGGDYISEEKEVQVEQYDTLHIDAYIPDGHNLELLVRYLDEDGEIFDSNTYNLTDGNNTYEMTMDQDCHEIYAWVQWGKIENRLDSARFNYLGVEKTVSSSYQESTSDDRVNGMFSYRLYLDDSDPSAGVHGYSSWFTGPWNLTDWDLIPDYSLDMISYYVKIKEVTERSDPSENELDIYHTLRYHHGESTTPTSINRDKEYSKNDFTDDEWKYIEHRTGGSGWDTAGFNITADTGTDWEGYFIVQVDFIVHTYAMSKVTPYMYNMYTGEGINRERLQLQYKTEEGHWADMGYEPEVWWIKGLELEIRAVDYWQQTIWQDKITPVLVDEVIKIPVPILKVTINHDEDWTAPWFSISRAGSTRGVQGWQIEVIGNRKYKFAWSGFDKYMGGEQWVDFGHSEEVVQSFYGSSGDEEEGIQTNDSKVSNIQHGHAYMDLELSIDPEKVSGYPPLDLMNISTFPEHHLAAIGYEWFDITPEQYNPYVHDLWPTYLLAIKESWVFQILTIVSLGLGLTFYYLRIRGMALREHKIRKIFHEEEEKIIEEQGGKS